MIKDFYSIYDEKERNSTKENTIVYKRIENGLKKYCFLNKNPKNCNNIMKMQRNILYGNEDIFLKPKSNNISMCSTNFCIPFNNSKEIRWIAELTEEDVWYSNPMDYQMLIPIQYASVLDSFIPVLFEINSKKNLFYSLLTICQQHFKYFVKLDKGKNSYEYKKYWSLRLSQTKISIFSCSKVENNINKCNKKILKPRYFDHFFVKVKCFDNPLKLLKDAKSYLLQILL